MDTLTSGISLYKVFKSCLDEGKDKARLIRLESRLDTFNSNLTPEQKRQFALSLVQQGLITGPLASAIQTFNCAFNKIG